jgi:hypothetical protein
MKSPTLPPLCVCAVVVVLSLPYRVFAVTREGTRTVRNSTNLQQQKGRKHPTVETIWRGIKSAAQNEVRSNSPLITVPKFIVTQKGSTRQLTIVKGDVGELGFGDDPYELPFRKQILIESLRRSLTETDLSIKKLPATAEASRREMADAQMESTGKSYLESAEKLVRKTVADIESKLDKNLLVELLRENERQIDDLLYDKIYRAVEQVAERNHYNIIYGRGGGEIKKFSVTITTVPDGAKVFLMTDLVYRKQLMTKSNPSQWPWIEVVQNPYQLLGKYRYLTTWTNGKRAEGSIDVANSSPLTLRQN